jgi:hypothetical protein
MEGGRKERTNEGKGAWQDRQKVGQKEGWKDKMRSINEHELAEGMHEPAAGSTVFVAFCAFTFCFTLSLSNAFRLIFSSNSTHILAPSLPVDRRAAVGNEEEAGRIGAKTNNTATIAASPEIARRNTGLCGRGIDTSIGTAL